MTSVSVVVWCGEL